MAEKKYRTNYAVAVNWLNNDYVLCNNIGEVDPSIWDNMRFSLWYYEDEDGNYYDNESDYEGDGELQECQNEIYQYFLTDASESDVEYLEEHFGLLFTYSDLLDLYVLCVDHYGTSWDYVGCETDVEYAAAELGERKK